jgi:expansin (peptidoglycan-binding protein)
MDIRTQLITDSVAKRNAGFEAQADHMLAMADDIRDIEQITGMPVGATGTGTGTGGAAAATASTASANDLAALEMLNEGISGLEAELAAARTAATAPAGTETIDPAVLEGAKQARIRLASVISEASKLPNGAGAAIVQRATEALKDLD